MDVTYAFPIRGNRRSNGSSGRQLESLVRASSSPQALVFRCRLILRAADRDHPTNLQIAAEFDCNRHTVAGWRNRYLSNGLAGLQDGRGRDDRDDFPPRRGSI